MAHITLYSEPDFKGTAVEFYSAVPQLDDWQFNDLAQSYAVTSGMWALYSDNDYAGALPGLRRAGQQRNLVGEEAQNISSLRPMPEDGIVLFDGADGEGAIAYFTADVPDLTAVNFENKTQSVYVPSGGAWNLYRDANYGRQITSALGSADSVQNLSSDQVKTVSSVRKR